jgi:hypothetical protein
VRSACLGYPEVAASSDASDVGRLKPPPVACLRRPVATGRGSAPKRGSLVPRMPTIRDRGGTGAIWGAARVEDWGTSRKPVDGPLNGLDTKIPLGRRPVWAGGAVRRIPEPRPKSGQPSPGAVGQVGRHADRWHRGAQPAARVEAKRPFVVRYPARRQLFEETLMLAAQPHEVVSITPQPPRVQSRVIGGPCGDLLNQPASNRISKFGRPIEKLQ